MQHMLMILGLIGSSVFLAASALINWNFGQLMGQTNEAKMALAGMSVAADLMKALVPFFIAAAWKHHKMAAISGLALWCVCVVYSLTTAIGFGAMNRAALQDNRSGQQDTYARTREQLKTAQNRLAKIPQHRPTGVVTSAIEAHKQNRRWQSTDGCTNATARKSRAYCKQYHTLHAELASSQLAATLNTQIEKLSAQLNDANTSGQNASTTDPQVRVLAEISNLQQNKVQLLLVGLLAVLSELGSSLGFFISMTGRRAAERPQKAAEPAPSVAAEIDTPQPQKTAVAASEPVSAPPEQQLPAPKEMPDDNLAPQAIAELTPAILDRLISNYLDERTQWVEGASVIAADLHADFCNWCSARGVKTQATQRMFGDRLRETTDLDKRRIGGKIKYTDIQLLAAG